MLISVTEFIDKNRIFTESLKTVEQAVVTLQAVFNDIAAFFQSTVDGVNSIGSILESVFLGKLELIAQGIGLMAGKAAEVYGETEIGFINHKEAMRLIGEQYDNAEIDAQKTKEAKLKAANDAARATNKAAIIKNNQDLIGDDKKALAEYEKGRKQDIADREATGRTIASMSTANNKTLAGIGKAAALIQIAIDTPVAIGKALAAFPPPFNYAAAAAVGAAMAFQAARVSGIALAEGGIVQATPGGIQATIGEGGRDEAVIPLDEDGRSSALGGTYITINVNGGLLGDQASARELAMALDLEIYKLRKNNESRAFDTGLL